MHYSNNTEETQKLVMESFGMVISMAKCYSIPPTVQPKQHMTQGGCREASEQDKHWNFLYFNSKALSKAEAVRVWFGNWLRCIEKYLLRKRILFAC